MRSLLSLNPVTVHQVAGEEYMTPSLLQSIGGRLADGVQWPHITGDATVLSEAR